MTTYNRKAEFNLEEKLADLNLTPSQRARAIGAMNAAEDLVDLMQSLGAVVKRIAGAFLPKTSIRA